MTLRKVAEEIWEATGFQPMGLVSFPIRMVVWRTDGKVTLWSPIAFDPSLADEVAALGPVAYVVAPNCFHHLHLTPWLDRFSQARLVAPVELKKKRPELDVALSLSDASEEFADSLSLVTVEGAPKMNETVILHKASRSLLACDLLFNVTEAEGWLSRMVFKMTGTYGGLNQSKLWRWGLTQDRSLAGQSVERILELDFARIIVAHGQIAENAGPQELAEATRWMRGVS